MKKQRRSNQKQRTRKDLLLAAARLLKEGRTPSVTEVAEEAMVSKATAYRYFPSWDALLAEAPLDGSVPTAEQLFGGDDADDPEERIDRAEAATHEMVYANEAQLRAMLIHTLNQTIRPRQQDRTLVRQNRRSDLIEAALAPARDRLSDDAHEKLCASLALFFGPEAMVVFRDVLAIDPTRAREVKSWAMRALVRAALSDRSNKT